MIANTQSRNGEFLSSSSQKSNMNMAVTAEAFRVMSSQIYQHKSAAVVREYMCNACDAHIDAGTQHIPYDVTIPTDMNPVFSVRDYGTGLDKHGVETVFSTYFQSTKKEKEESVGFLGLGSKSGYSYTDSFMINAYHNGTLRSYMAYFDETNIPALNLMGEWDTEEPNGVEISMTVKSQDIKTFRDDVAFMASFMKVKPNVINGYVWDENIASSLENTGWAIVGKDLPNYTTSLYQIRYDGIGIVMGGVVYPISNSMAMSLLEDTVHHSFINQMRTKLFVSVPMGSVEFAASRETLSFTESTREVVKNRLEEVIDGILKDIHDVTNSMDHVVKAYNYIEEKLGMVPHKMEWKDGKSVSVAKRTLLKFVNRNNLVYMKKTYGSTVTRMIGSNNLLSMYGDTKLVIKDCSRSGEVKYTRNHLINNNITGNVLVMKKPASPRMISRLCHIFGIGEDDIIRASDIIPVTKKKSEKLSNNTQIRGTWRSFSEPEFRTNSIMETDGFNVAYVDIDLRDRDRCIMFKYDEKSPTIRMGLTGFHGAASVMDFVGVDRIIVRNKQNSKRIEKLGIPSLHAKIRSFIDEQYDYLKELSRLHLIRANHSISLHGVVKKMIECECEGITNFDGVDRYLDIINSTTVGYSSEYKKLADMVEFDQKVEEVGFIDKFEGEMISFIQSKYPLIGYLSSIDTCHVEYIKAMDLYREAQQIEQM